MTEPAATLREIPFNYTSADDRQAVTFLLGGEVWTKLEVLRSRRVTGRSARLLLRVLGEILIHRRNAFLLQELVELSRRPDRETLVARLRSNAQGHPPLSIDDILAARDADRR